MGRQSVKDCVDSISDETLHFMDNAHHLQTNIPTNDIQDALNVDKHSTFQALSARLTCVEIRIYPPFRFSYHLGLYAKGNSDYRLLTSKIVRREIAARKLRSQVQRKRNTKRKLVDKCWNFRILNTLAWAKMYYHSLWDFEIFFSLCVQLSLICVAWNFFLDPSLKNIKGISD